MRYMMPYSGAPAMAAEAAANRMLRSAYLRKQVGAGGMPLPPEG